MDVAQLQGTNTPTPGVDSYGVSPANISNIYGGPEWTDWPGYNPYDEDNFIKQEWNKIKDYFSGLGDKFKNWFLGASGINFYKNLGNFVNGSNPQGSVTDFLYKAPEENFNQGSDITDVLGDGFNPSEDWLDSLYDSAQDKYDDYVAKTFDFNREEAQKQRDWEEYMQNTYYQRMMNSLKEAGINPLLAFDSLGGSSVPSGASASMNTPNSNSLFNGYANSLMSNKKIRMALTVAILSLLGKFIPGSKSIDYTDHTSDWIQDWFK